MIQYVICCNKVQVLCGGQCVKLVDLCVVIVVIEIGCCQMCQLWQLFVQVWQIGGKVGQIFGWQGDQNGVVVMGCQVGKGDVIDFFGLLCVVGVMYFVFG